MKLTRLHVENFKSLRDLTLEPDSELAILIGRNEAGKSNVLDAIMFANDLIGSSQGEYIAKRGGSTGVIYAGIPNGEVVINLELTMDKTEVADLSEVLPEYR